MPRSICSAPIERIRALIQIKVVGPTCNIR
jgi:hypothetical protein